MFSQVILGLSPCHFAAVPENHASPTLPPNTSNPRKPEYAKLCPGRAEIKNVFFNTSDTGIQSFKSRLHKFLLKCWREMETADCANRCYHNSTVLIPS